MRGQSLDHQKIKEYLHFGYLPVEKDQYPFSADEVCRKEVTDNPDNLLKESYRIFRLVVSDSLSTREIVVPLSGGTDSRIILAELHNQLGPDKITAVTFGVPGSLDFELPQKITRKFGINHQLINLYKQDFSEKKLLDFAANTQVPSLLVEAYCNDLLRKKVGNEVTFYSGFIGDRIMGSMPRNLREMEDFEEAKSLFIKNSRHDKTGFLPVLDPDSFEVNNDHYSFLGPYEKIDYKIRLRNMTTAIVLDQNYDYKTPLTDPELVSFFHSIEPRFRDNQALFFKMAAEFYPDFFSIGVKNFFGSKITSGRAKKSLLRKISYARRIFSRQMHYLQVKDPLENYLSPVYFYIQNPSTSEMAEKNLKDLKKRGILKNLNPVRALELFKMGKTEYKNAVELLFNLEMYLKADVLK